MSPPEVCDSEADEEMEILERTHDLVLGGLDRTLTEEVLATLENRVEPFKAEKAAYVLGFADYPTDLEQLVVAALLRVLADASRPDLVRGQAAESIGNVLAFKSRHRQRTQAGRILIDCLGDPSPVVRFWSAFALGSMPYRKALPALRVLTTDQEICPDWWRVGDEASDAIDRIKGREPPDRDRFV
jgi:hypothetical protein